MFLSMRPEAESQFYNLIDKNDIEDSNNHNRTKKEVKND